MINYILNFEEIINTLPDFSCHFISNVELYFLHASQALCNYVKMFIQAVRFG